MHLGGVRSFSACVNFKSVQVMSAEHRLMHAGASVEPEPARDDAELGSLCGWWGYVANNVFCHVGRHVVVHAFIDMSLHHAVYACCYAGFDIFFNSKCGSSHNFDKCRHAVIDSGCDGCHHVVVDACCSATCDIVCNAEGGLNHNFDRCRHVAVNAYCDECCYAFSNAFDHAARHFVFCAFCHRFRHSGVYSCYCAICDIICNAECGSSHNFDRCRHAVIDVCCDECRHVVFCACFYADHDIVCNAELGSSHIIIAVSEERCILAHFRQRERRRCIAKVMSRAQIRQGLVDDAAGGNQGCNLSSSTPHQEGMRVTHFG